MKQVTKDTAPATGSGICKHCGEVYNRKEIIRVYGEFSPVLAEGFCSSSCYTKSHYDTAPATAPIDNKDDDFIELDVPIKTPLWEDDKPDNKDALQDAFTGGDWKAAENYEGIDIPIWNENECIATVWANDKHEANAALLSQAKNMYNKLKDILSDYEGFWDADDVNSSTYRQITEIKEILLKANQKQ